jgi:hypothetical protein
MTNYKYTAILIEPRCHKAISFVLNNFLDNLWDEWGFIIFHGNKNQKFIEDIIANDLPEQNKKSIKLINMNIDNLLRNEYNTLLKTKYIYNHIDTELFLIFQLDTLILKSNKHLIYDYLEYDYVGAPWGDGKIGNGGLSLRKKSKMLEIIDKVDINFKQNEDEYYTRQEEVDLFVPNINKAKRFSVETQYYKSPFGVHNCYNYISKEEWIELSTTYPELQELYKLNVNIKDKNIHNITVVFINDDDSLKNLKKSLDTFIQYYNLDKIYEIIIYIHNRIYDDTIVLLDTIQLIQYANYRIIPLHYNYHGYIKQKVNVCNAYKDCKTKYITLINCNTLFTKDINHNDYIENEKVNLKKQIKDNLNIFLFTNNSLQEAANQFINNNNMDYESYYETIYKNLNINIFDEFPEMEKKNIFDEIKYILDYCKKNSNEYIVPLKTIVFVFTHKVCNLVVDDTHNFWGIGDMIRGLINVYQLAKKYNYNLIIDIQLHVIGEYLEIINHEYSNYILENKNNICFIDDPESHIKNNKDDLIYFFSNQNYKEEITEECREFIKNILKPNEQFNDYIEKQLEFNNTPCSYNILHFRLGDDGLVRKKNKDYSHLNNRLENNIEENDILMSDSKDFKNYCKLKFPNLFQYNMNIGHIGLLSHKDSIKDTLFELMIITKAKKIKTYTVHSHISGFVKFIHDIYNIKLDII